MEEGSNAPAIAAIVSALFSAGAFKFYESVLKSKRDADKETKAERLKYRDDLIRRVGKLERERDEHVDLLMQLRSEVAALKVEVGYLQRENRKLQR